MPVNPTNGGGDPVSAAIESRSDRRDRRVPGRLGRLGPVPQRDLDGGLGAFRDEFVDQRTERREDLLGILLTRDDPAIDLHLAAIGDDVRGTAAADERHVDRRRADERMDPFGQRLRQAQQEPRHREDRVDAALRLRAVRGLPVRDGRDPGTPAFGEGDLHLGRLAHDRGVLVEQVPVRGGPWCRGSRRALRRRPDAGRAFRRATGRRGGSPRRPRARTRSVPSCRTPRGPPASRRRRRPRTERSTRWRVPPRERCRGARSRRGVGAPRSRSAPRRSDVRPRTGRPGCRHRGR